MYLSLFSVSFGCGRFLVYILPSRLTSRWNRSSNACSCEHGMRFPRYFTISSGYGGLRRNLAPGFQQYMLKLVCAGIMTALRSLYHILRICYSLRGMHTRRSGVLAPFGRQRLGAGIMPATQPLYHILRIWQPPAELSARFSAVNAETGMRRYNACYAAIIPYLVRNGNGD